MTDYERDVVYGMLCKDLKKEQDQYKHPVQ